MSSVSLRVEYRIYHSFAPFQWSVAIGVLAIQAIRVLDRQATPFWRKPLDFCGRDGSKRRSPDLLSQS